MVNADRCVCVRDIQRCSGPFSYVTVEIAFFKALPSFLSDVWRHPGSREQCCMCCFSCTHAISRSVFCHITHAHACSSTLPFPLNQSNLSILYPPTLQVIPLPAWDSWLYWWRVSAMSQHVMFLLLGYLKPWALCCPLSRVVLFVICFSCCWGDTTQTAFPTSEIFIFMAASCYFRVKAFYGPKATLKNITVW